MENTILLLQFANACSILRNSPWPEGHGERLTQSTCNRSDLELLGVVVQDHDDIGDVDFTVVVDVADSIGSAEVVKIGMRSPFKTQCGAGRFLLPHLAERGKPCLHNLQA